MKILIVNTFYYPNMVGGCEHSVKLLAEGLKKSGNQIIVFTIDNLYEKGLKKEKINEINVIRCSGGYFDTNVRITKKGSSLKKIINKIVELKNSYVLKQYQKVLKLYKPDIVHTNNLYGLSPVIWKTTKKEKIKLVHTIRDYWILDPSTEYKKRKNFAIKLYQLYLKNLSQNVDFVSAPSKFTLNAILNNNYFKNSKAKVVPNCIEFDKNNLQNILKEKSKIKNQKIKFIYVGMLEEKKGIMNLLKAFEKINNQNISLDICGDGKLKDLIKKYCQSDARIKYNGKLSKNELEKVWKKCDACIVPSIWDEPFGRVVIEANLYGLPVIGANKGGIVEIIDNTKSGKLFQYDDINDLTNKINYFSNRDNIKKYYENIYKNIGMYSVENQIKEFEKIYKNLLK